MHNDFKQINLISGDTPARPDQCVEGLVQVIADRFKLLHVSEDSDLATVLKKHGFTFQAGGVFYEFTRSKETITEQKEIILMDKVLSYINFCW